MAAYGDADQVKVMLRADESIPFGADIDSRIEALNPTISATVDDATGRTFGVAGAATTELHWVGPYDQIILNRPATAITKITYGGTVSGSTMTGGTDILAADLVTTMRDAQGRIYAIRAATGGVWSWYDTAQPFAIYARTPVAVTATYDTFGYDASTVSDVPADITYIVNYMISERIKLEKAGPAGFTGPAGDVVPVRDVFGDPLVRRVIDKYRVKELVV